jgi:hypothetical protein
MAKFEYDFNIEATTKEEAKIKMEALKILASRLNAIELQKLAHIVKNDPKTLAMAKGLMGV